MPRKHQGPTLVLTTRVDPRTLELLARFYSRQGIPLTGRSSVIELALRDHAELIMRRTNLEMLDLDSALTSLQIMFPDTEPVNRRSVPSIALHLLSEEKTGIEATENRLLESDSRSEELRKLLEQEGTKGG